MKTVILYLLVSILLVNTAYAIKPGTSLSSATAGYLDITYPLFDFVKQYESFTFQFHVFDSNLTTLTNATVSCQFHLYNKSGNHIIENFYLKFDDVSKADFYMNYTFNYTGAYDYIVWCNSTKLEQGVVEQGFKVTSTGDALNDYTAIVLFLIALLPLTFGLIFFIGTASLGDDHPALKWFAYLLLPLMYISTLHACILTVIRYMDFLDMQDFVVTTTYWIYLIFFGIISYACLYFIIKAFRSAAQEKQEKLEY